MVNIMTPLDLPAIEARCEAATPGPWMHKRLSQMALDIIKTFTGVDLDVSDWPGDVVEATRQGQAILWKSDYATRVYDAAFIAHARTDIPALVEALEHAHYGLDTLNDLNNALDAALHTAVTRVEELESEIAVERARLREWKAQYRKLAEDKR